MQGLRWREEMHLYANDKYHFSFIPSYTWDCSTYLNLILFSFQNRKMTKNPVQSGIHQFSGLVYINQVRKTRFLMNKIIYVFI